MIPKRILLSSELYYPNPVFPSRIAAITRLLLLKTETNSSDRSLSNSTNDMNIILSTLPPLQIPSDK